MKITELIEQLNIAKAAYGDIDVLLFDPERCTYETIMNVIHISKQEGIDRAMCNDSWQEISKPFIYLERS